MSHLLAQMESKFEKTVNFKKSMMDFIYLCYQPLHLK